MNAADAPIVVTRRTCSTGTPRTGAAAASRGNMVAVSAVLLVNSVANTTNVQTPKTMIHEGSPENAVAWAAISAAQPVS